MNDSLKRLQESIEYSFSDPSLLENALRHASASDRQHQSNERLEFLGDAVIGLAVAEKIHSLRPPRTEGEMTAMKSAAVRGPSLELVGRDLNLQDFLLTDEGLSRGEAYPGSLIAAAYEALVGAIFLDGGWAEARDFVIRTLAAQIQKAERGEHQPNFKAILQEKLQAEGKAPPQYVTVKALGPAHNKRFQAAVTADGRERGSGWGATKKEAQQNAACAALEELYPTWRDER